MLSPIRLASLSKQILTNSFNGTLRFAVNLLLASLHYIQFKLLLFILNGKQMLGNCHLFVVKSWSENRAKFHEYISFCQQFICFNQLQPLVKPSQHWVKSCTPWNQWKFWYVNWARAWLIISPLLESSWASLFISMVFINFAGKRLPLVPDSDFTSPVACHSSSHPWLSKCI